MAERKEVRIAGAGSHGVIEAGLILQEAAAIYDDLNAHHVQSYGPEARSDAARSEVIVSDGDIDYPKATQLDALLVTTQQAADRYLQDLKPGAVLIYDESVVLEIPEGAQSFKVPLIKIAEEQLQKPGLLHIVALGLLVAKSEVVSKAAIEAAVRDHVPRGGEDLYLQALETGFTLQN